MTASVITINKPGDGSAREDVYDTERQLLEVACTRVRDELFVTPVEPVSEFVADREPKTASGRGNPA